PSRSLRGGGARRGGESRSRRAELRLVAASAEDLASGARDGRFRSDLFEAIDRLRIDVPPLRARRADVAQVAEALLVELGGNARGPAARLPSVPPPAPPRPGLPPPP